MNYIQAISGLNDKVFSETGRKPSMFIQTFGCQMNDRESEKLYGYLAAMGYEEAPVEEQADLVLYNTCCVRESAENKVYGKLGNLKSQKEKHPEKIIVFCGCMPQREDVMTQIYKHHKHVDVIFGTFNKHHFPMLLYRRLTEGKPAAEILHSYSDLPSEDFEQQVSRFLPHKAGVTIMHGCDNFCSYCIVPHVRGREKSREPDDILKEINSLASDGVKEVMLLGQNVNSYIFGFPGLLQKIADVPEIKRVRFMTSHPKDLSRELIKVISENDKICKHIHLPIQAGSDKVLKAMNRGYTKEQYLDLVYRLRTEIPAISVTTDIIVGFPGETEEDFEDTLDAVQKAEFSGAFTFLYSHRKGTPAAEMTTEVPRETAQNRFNKLIQLLNPIQLAYNKRFYNKVVEVFADNDSSGRADNNILVHFEGKASAGSIINVQINECKTFYMKGNIV